MENHMLEWENHGKSLFLMGNLKLWQITMLIELENLLFAAISIAMAPKLCKKLPEGNPEIWESIG